MRGYPAKYFAKFYLSRRIHKYEAIQGMLTANNLGGIEEDDLRDLDAEMSYPTPFRPKDIKHRASHSFLKQEGIFEAWHPGNHMKQAWKILEMSRLRHIVETLLLSPLTIDQAARSINIKAKTDQSLSIGSNILPRSLELFQHYFWNKNELSGAEWGQFIRSRESAHEEWLQLAVDARGPGGVQMLLWKTGLGAARSLSTRRIFTDIRDIAYNAIQQIALSTPSRHHAEMLRNYAQVAKLGQEEIDATTNAVEDVVQAFQAFRMRHVEQQTPSIKELTGGNYSEAHHALAEHNPLGE